MGGATTTNKCDGRRNHYKQPRQHLYVFVTVQMGRANPRPLHLLDLRAPLSFYFRQIQALRGQSQKKRFRTSREFASIV